MRTTLPCFERTCYYPGSLTCNCSCCLKHLWFSNLAAGHSEEKLGGAAACAVKRTHLDARMAKCAAHTGADLMEEFEVGSASVTLDREAGLWTVKSTEVFTF